MTDVFFITMGWIIILVLIENIALTCLKQFSLTPNSHLYILIPMILYGIGIPYLLYRSLDFEGIGTVNFIWNVFSTISMIIIGYYVFGETVSHLKFIGVSLGIVGLILVGLADS